MGKDLGPRSNDHSDALRDAQLQIEALIREWIDEADD